MRKKSALRHIARRWSALLFVSAAFVACDRDQSPQQFDGEAALRYATEQVNFGPRVPGSAGWQKGGDWIVSQMKQRADTVTEQRWWHRLASGDSIPMRNIFARWHPDATDRILYVVHWDTRPVAEKDPDPAKRGLPIPGANDGASGVGLLVALADILKAHPPSIGVDFLFVDGEDYGNFDTNTDVLIGSTYFAANLPTPDYRPIFGVLWDMIGDADLQIYQEQYSVNRAPEVVARIWQIAADQGKAHIFIPSQKYAIVDDHIPLLDAGLRVADVIDLDYPYHHQHADTIDKLSVQSLKTVGNVALALIRSMQ